MSTRIPQDQFLTFNQAVAAARENSGEEFVALNFDQACEYLGMYTVWAVDEEEPDYVSIMFSGGLLYSSCGEEDTYDLDDVPSEAKSLLYLHKKHLPDIHGDMVSEHVLYNVFNELQDPETMWTRQDRAKFAADAAKLLAQHWRKA